MANYETLKSAIQQVVKTNNNNEITGALLQQTLLAIINSLGAGYQFMGVATPETNPGTPDYNIAYIAGNGTYPNFNNTTINNALLGILKFNGQWVVETISIPNIFVQTTPKLYTLAEKEHARENIGAASESQVGENTRDIAGLKDQIENYRPIEIIGDVVNAPDEEDLTTNSSNLLQFKNRSSLDGMGYVILRKGKTFAEQVTTPNTIYEIRYNFELDDEFVMPNNCVLSFNGGSISGERLKLANTLIVGIPVIGLSLWGSIKNEKIFSSWFSSISLSVSNVQALKCGICIDNNYTLDEPLSLFGIANVEIKGKITNDSTNYLEIGNSSSLTNPVKIDIWNTDFVKLTGGKVLDVSVRNCNTFIIEADSTKTGKGSVAYCTFHLGIIRNFAIIGYNNGWINENTFIKGRFIDSFLIQGGTYYHNNNVFYNPALEGDVVITFEHCTYNTMYDVRLEGTPIVSFTRNARCNKLYRNWLNTPDSLMRGMYRSSIDEDENGIYYNNNSTFVKKYTIDKNTFIGHRNLDVISICDDERVRIEGSGTYATLQIEPKTDIGIVLMSDSIYVSRTQIRLYDKQGFIISDDVTEYLNTFGNFTRNATNPNDVYYYNNVDLNEIYQGIRVNTINRYLENIYGVDESGNPIKMLGMVEIRFRTGNVRRSFKYIDLRVLTPINAKDDAGVVLKFTSYNAANISTKVPTITASISGVAIPYSIIDGETCLVTSKKAIYKRIGNEIVLDRSVGASGSTRPTLTSIDVGYIFFDTTLGKPIYWAGTKWVDSTGANA